MLQVEKMKYRISFWITAIKCVAGKIPPSILATITHANVFSVAEESNVLRDKENAHRAVYFFDWRWELLSFFVREWFRIIARPFISDEKMSNP